MSLNLKISSLNSSLQSSLDFGDKTTFYNLCQLTEKTNPQDVSQTYPIENIGDGQARLIHPNDTYPLQIYHRLLDTTKDNDFTLGLGNKAQGTLNYSLRLVGLGTRNSLTVAGFEDNQEFAAEVAENIPSILVTGGKKDFIEVTDIEAVKQNVWNEEFIGIDLKHLKLDRIAFYVEYTLKVKIC